MEKGSRGQALNASYSLRRHVVPSKRFDDFYLEKQHLPKKKDLQAGENLAKKSEEGSTSNSSLSLLPLPNLSGNTLSCGDSSSAVSQHFSGSSLPEKTEYESTCKVSGPTVSTIPEASGRVGHRRKQANPCRVVPCEVQAEEDMETHTVPLDFKPCSAEQKDVGSLDSAFLNSGQSQRETQLSSQTPMDSTPKAPKVTKAKVAPQGKPKNSNDLKQRLEIAAMLLQLAQDVPALVPEAGCHIKLKGELLKIQKCISKGNKTTPKGCSKTLKPRSTGKHGQKRKHVDSLDSGLVMGPEWTAARDKEDMFFPNLEDSSLMAEAKERKRREAEQESSLRQMAEPVEDRYIKNAAVLPDLRPPPVAPSPAQSSSEPQQSEPLLIHGHTVEEYQAIYHSVVDPMMKTKSGNDRPYSLALGRAIKQRLWERLFCPTIVERVDADSRVHITESFSAPTLKSFAPNFDVDISGEPLPGEPQQKRARR